MVPESLRKKISYGVSALRPYEAHGMVISSSVEEEEEPTDNPGGRRGSCIDGGRRKGTCLRGEYFDIRIHPKNNEKPREKEANELADTASSLLKYQRTSS